jgi:uncharacterized protein YlxW (UPF0749 family)
MSTSATTIRRRLALRATRTQAVVAIIFVALGFLLVLAIRDEDEVVPLGSARTEDLVTILDDLTTRRGTLEAEVRRLEVARERLVAGSEGQAIVEAQRRANALEVLAGTTQVAGEGIEVRIDADTGVRADTVLDAVQELRDAGAEAIAVNGLRVVVNTWFADSDAGVVISGTPVTAPITIAAIGDPQTMTTALRIPGGVAESVRAADGTIRIEPADEVVVPPVAVTPAG